MVTLYFKKYHQEHRVKGGRRVITEISFLLVNAKWQTI